MNLRDIDFYFVTDSVLTRKNVVEDVKAGLQGGVKVIQYREKKKCTREMYEEALQIRMLCEGRAIFLVNDRVDIALAVSADGVHLGQNDMPYHAARSILGTDKIIGLTAHNLQEASEAEDLGADYIGASPIFDTKTKLDAGKGAGLELLMSLKGRIRVPVVAIGGITLDNVAEVIRAGAYSASAISAVIAKDNTAAECARFIKIIHNTKNDNNINKM